MQIHAGKTSKSRYDGRAPIHIGVGIDEPRSLCGGIPIAPITDGNRVVITCPRCQDAAFELDEVLAS